MEILKKKLKAINVWSGMSAQLSISQKGNKEYHDIRCNSCESLRSAQGQEQY